MGGRIRQLASAHDDAGQEYMLVQLDDRILIWRVEAQAGSSAAMA